MKRVENYIFAPAIILFIINEVFSSSALSVLPSADSAFKAVRYLVYALLAIKVLSDIIISRKLPSISAFAIGIIALLCFVFGKNLAPLIAVLFLLAAKDVSADKIIKISLVTLCASVVAAAISGSLFGPEFSYARPDGTVRYSLGFIYPSHPASYLFFGALLLAAERKEKLSFLEGGIMLILNAAVFGLTNARASFFATFFAVIILCLCAYVYRKGKGELVNRFAKMSAVAAPISAVVCLIFALLYHKDIGFINAIDAALSGRVALAARGIDSFGLTLFGTEINWIGLGAGGVMSAEYNFVDCSYMRIILEYGIIFGFSAAAIYCLAAIKHIKNGRAFLCLSLAAAAVYSVAEPRLINIGFNPLFLLTAVAIMGAFTLPAVKKEGPI